MKRARNTVKSLVLAGNTDNTGISIVDQFHHQFTGGDAYEGGVMLEYEVNPMAGGSCVYFPNISIFTTEHIERFTLGQPDNLLEDVLVGLCLCDLPHEVSCCRS